MNDPQKKKKVKHFFKTSLTLVMLQFCDYIPAHFSKSDFLFSVLSAYEALIDSPLCRRHDGRGRLRGGVILSHDDIMMPHFCVDPVLFGPAAAACCCLHTLYDLLCPQHACWWRGGLPPFLPPDTHM